MSEQPIINHAQEIADMISSRPRSFNYLDRDTITGVKKLANANVLGNPARELEHILMLRGYEAGEEAMISQLGMAPPRSEWAATNPKTIGESFVEMVGSPENWPVPFAHTINQAREIWSVNRSMNKLKELGRLAEENPDATESDLLKKMDWTRDELLDRQDHVRMFFEQQEEAMMRGETFSSAVMGGITQSLEFMAEFAMTHGASKKIVDHAMASAAKRFGTTAAKKGLLKTIVSGLSNKAKAWMHAHLQVGGTLSPHTATKAILETMTRKQLVGHYLKTGAQAGLRDVLTAGVQTTMMPHRVVLGAGQRVVGGESPASAWARGFGNVFAENISEVQGERISKLVSKALPTVSRLKRKTMLAFRKAANRFYGSRLTPALARFLRIGKFDGILEEMGEERFGDVVRAVLNTDDFGLDEKERGLVARLAAAASPGLEPLLQELVSFTAMPVGARLVGAPGQLLTKVRMDRARSDLERGPLFKIEAFSKPVGIKNYVATHTFDAVTLGKMGLEGKPISRSDFKRLAHTNDRASASERMRIAKAVAKEVPGSMMDAETVADYNDLLEAEQPNLARAEGEGYELLSEEDAEYQRELDKLDSELQTYSEIMKQEYDAFGGELPPTTSSETAMRQRLESQQQGRQGEQAQRPQQEQQPARYDFQTTFPAPLYGEQPGQEKLAQIHREIAARAAEAMESGDSEQAQREFNQYEQQYGAEARSAFEADFVKKYLKPESYEYSAEGSGAGETVWRRMPDGRVQIGTVKRTGRKGQNQVRVPGKGKGMPLDSTWLNLPETRPELIELREALIGQKKKVTSKSVARRIDGMIDQLAIAAMEAPEEGQRQDFTPKQEGVEIEVPAEEPAPAPQPPKAEAEAKPLVEREPKPPREYAEQTEFGLGKPGDLNINNIARQIERLLAGGMDFQNITEVREFVAKSAARANRMDSYAIAPGSPDATAVTQAVKLAVVRAARQTVEDGRKAGQTNAEILESLMDLYQRQPSISGRDSSTVEMQQYDTPIPLAFVLGVLTDSYNADVVYEPTAGNGALLIDLSGTTEAHVNELDPRRSAALKDSLGVNTVATEYDAATHQERELVGGKQADAVLANPPFGTRREDGKGPAESFPMAGRPGISAQTEHLEYAIAWNALGKMKDDGRAALILGAPKPNQKEGTEAYDRARSESYDSGDRVRFIIGLYKTYNVVDHFVVDGSLYEKNGAKWPVDVFVIDGRGQSKLDYPASSLPTIFRSWDNVKEVLNEYDMADKRATEAGVDALRPDHSGRRAAEPGAVGGGGLLRTPDEAVGVGAEAEGREGLPDQGTPLPPAPDTTGGLAEGAGDGAVGSTGTGDGGTGRQGDEGRGTDVAGQAQSDAGDEAGDRGAEGVPPGGTDGHIFVSTGTGTTVGGQELAQEQQNKRDALIEKLRKLSKKKGGDEPTRPAKPAPYYPAKLPDMEQLDTATELALMYADLGQTSFEQFVRQLNADAPDLVESLGREFIRAVYANTWDMADPANYSSMTTLAQMKDITDDQIRDWIDNPLVADQDASVDEEIRDSDEAHETADIEKETQVPYEPLSWANDAKRDAQGLFVPRNISTALVQTNTQLLDYIMEETGLSTFEDYVARMLKIDVFDIPELYREQLDTVAAAIWQIDHGQAYVMGHQTGVGKGRIIGSQLAYAKAQGKPAVFVTSSTDLYASMMDDLADLGISDFKPFVTDKTLTGGKALVTKTGSVVGTRPDWDQAVDAFLDTGKLPDADAVFTTYSQMQTVKGSETKRHELLRAYVKSGAVLIFDESHNAGGSGQQVTGRAEFARELAQASSGVLYSSATWNKRPDTLSLYARTNIANAVDGKQWQLLSDVLTNGGVPLAAWTAVGLARDGQYARFERSFAGCRVRAHKVPIDAKTIDSAATALNSMNLYAKKIKDAMEKIRGLMKKLAKGQKTKGYSVTSISFGNIFANMYSQMLLSIKAEQTADYAIEQAKLGKKPIITLYNTMGSAIDDYAKREGLTAGDIFDMSYADIYLKYLEKMRTVTVTNKETGEVETRRLTDNEIGPEAGDLYSEVIAAVDNDSIRNLPISPIDAMIHKMEQAGLRTGEVTGREWGLDYGKMGVSERESSPGNEVMRPALFVRGSAERSKSGKLDAITRFNGGFADPAKKQVSESDRIDALIINSAGAEGINLHASNEFGDQRPRHMITNQPDLNIANVMQLWGRINRANQANPPEYTIFTTDSPSEIRPTAILVKKMAQLNASVLGEAEGGMSLDDQMAADFLNAVGDEVWAAYLEDNRDIHYRMGLPIDSTEGFSLERAGTAQKASGYVALLDQETQREVYAEVSRLYDEEIALLNATGTNPLKTQTLKLDAKTVNAIEISAPRTDVRDKNSRFAGGVQMEYVDMKKMGKPMTYVQVIQELRAKAGLPAYTHSELAEKSDKELLKELTWPSHEEALTARREIGNLHYAEQIKYENMLDEARSELSGAQKSLRAMEASVKSSETSTSAIERAAGQKARQKMAQQVKSVADLELRVDAAQKIVNAFRSANATMRASNAAVFKDTERVHALERMADEILATNPGQEIQKAVEDYVAKTQESIGRLESPLGKAHAATVKFVTDAVELRVKESQSDLEYKQRKLREAEEKLEKADKSDPDNQKLKELQASVKSWAGMVELGRSEIGRRSNEGNSLIEQLDAYALGKFVALHHRVVSGGQSIYQTYLGAVIDLSCSIKTAPTSAREAAKILRPSSWRVRVAVADSARVIPFSLSKTSNRGRTGRSDSAPIIISPINTPSDVTQYAPQLKDATMSGAFAHATNTTREGRWMATGNLFRGYVLLGEGTVLNFTDSEGNIRQGILMPKNFDAAAYVEKMPVRFPAADQAKAYFELPSRTTLFLEGTSDEGILLTKMTQNGEHRYTVRVAASREKGGKYFLDSRLRELAGGEFVTVGNQMSANMSHDNFMAAIDRIYELGAELQATAQEHKAEAYQIIGVEPPKVRKNASIDDAIQNAAPIGPGRAKSRGRKETATAKPRTSVEVTAKQEAAERTWGVMDGVSIAMAKAYVPKSKSGKRVYKKMLRDIQRDHNWRVGYRSIVEMLYDAVSAELRVGRTQLGKAPAHYDPMGHLIRSRDGITTLNLHEFGHAVSRIIRETQPDVWEPMAQQLINATKTVLTGASSRTKEEGAADWFRMFMYDKAKLEATIPALSARMENVVKEAAPDIWNVVLDAQQMVQLMLKRPLIQVGTSITNDQPPKTNLHETKLSLLHNLVGADAVTLDVYNKAFRSIAKTPKWLNRWTDAMGLFSLGYSLVNKDYKKSLDAARDVLSKVQNSPADFRAAVHFLQQIPAEIDHAIRGVRRGREGIRVLAPAGGFDPILNHEVDIGLGTTATIGQIMESAGIGGFPPGNARHAEWMYLTDTSFASIKRKLGKEWDAFEQYGQWRTAYFRYIKLGHKYPGINDFKKHEDLKRELESIEAVNPDWLGYYKEINDWMNQLAKIAVLSGELDALSYADFLTRHSNYWPLLRIVENKDSEGFGPPSPSEPSSGFYRAHGSTLPFQRLEEAVKKRVTRTMTSYYTNFAIRHLRDFVRTIRTDMTLPFEVRAWASQMMTRLELDPKKLATVSKGEVKGLIGGALRKLGLKVPEESMEILAHPYEVWRLRRPNTVHIASVFDPNTSRRTYYQIGDPVVFDVLAHSKDPNKFVKWLSNFFGGMTKPWKRSLTQNWLFVVRNFLFRDPLMAIYKGQSAKEMVWGSSAAAAIVHRIKGGEGDMGAQEAISESELLSRALDHTTSDAHVGVVQSFMDMLKEGIVVENPLSLQNLPGVAMSTVMKPVDVFNWLTGSRHFSNLTEELTREGAYIRAREGRANVMTAQMKYSYLTGAFAQHGADANLASLMRAFGFVNPGLQILWGINQEMAYADPAMRAKTWLVKTPALAANVAVAAIINMLMIYMIYPPDEREIILDGLRERRDEDKERYMALGGFLRAPFDQGFVGAIASYAWNQTESVMLGDKRMSTETLYTMLFRALEMPGVGAFVPQGTVRPIIELGLNKSFFADRDIVPYWLRKKYPYNPELQTWPDTPNLYKALGRGLKVSPIKVHYGVRQTFTHMMDGLIQLGSGVATGEWNVKEAADVPIVGGLFIRKPIGWNSQSVKSVGQLHEQYDSLKNQVKDLANRAADQGSLDDPDVADRLNKMRSEIARLEPANDTMNEIEYHWRVAKESEAKGDNDAYQAALKRMVTVARAFVKYTEKGTPISSSMLSDRYYGKHLMAATAPPVRRKKDESMADYQKRHAAREESRKLAVDAVNRTAIDNDEVLKKFVGEWTRPKRGYKVSSDPKSPYQQRIQMLKDLLNKQVE
jgi:hypothetical protein